ncbi:hypothetical protein [Pseudomonas caspiana]|uniref:hypothetical protein n=1 Tax=Pseudomonas caspiana TaxID=1451454 RepID=UPI0032EB7156
MDKQKPPENGVKAVGDFQWSSAPGLIAADSITAEWQDGAWLIYASRGNPQRRDYQQFQLRIPAATAETPIQHQFISQPGTPEPGFVYTYIWNKPTGPDDFDAIRVGMEGHVHVDFAPENKQFSGRFAYITPRQSNLNIEGKGTYNFKA